MLLQKIASSERVTLSRAGGALALEEFRLGLANLTSQATVWKRASGTTCAGARRGSPYDAYLRRGDSSWPPATRCVASIGAARTQASPSLPNGACRAAPAPAHCLRVRFHADRAEREHAVIRRLSLPRNLLARLVEVM